MRKTQKHLTENKKTQQQHQQKQNKHEQTTPYKTHNRKQDNKHKPSSNIMKEHKHTKQIKKTNTTHEHKS